MADEMSSDELLAHLSEHVRKAVTSLSTAVAQPGNQVTVSSEDLTLLLLELHGFLAVEIRLYSALSFMVAVESLVARGNERTDYARRLRALLVLFRDVLNEDE